MTQSPLPPVLSSLAAGASLEEGLARALRRLVALTGAAGGALVFRPPHAAPIVVTTGARKTALALHDLVTGVVPISQSPGARAPLRHVLHIALGAAGRSV